VDSEVLITVAGVMLAQKQAQRALRLLAAARACRDREQSWRSISGVALYTRFREQAREMLTAGEVDSVRREGWQMTRNEAINAARQYLG
jgi:hypothetical protein